MDRFTEIDVFAAAVRHGSFAAAGRAKAMTPSGVSRAISRLEARLTVRLFNRSTRRMVLTEAGERYYRQVAPLLDQLAAAEGEMQLRTAEPSGDLRIAASDALTVERIIPFLPDFQAAYPKVRVSAVPGDGRINLLENRLDLALMFELPEEASLIARRLAEDPWVLCAAPAYLAAHGMPTSPDDLRSHECLTIFSGGVRQNCWDFGPNEAPRPILVDGSFSGIGLTIKAAVLQGLGLARLARFLVCDDIAAGRLVELLPGQLTKSDRAIHAVYPNRQFLPQKVRVFIDSFGAYLRAR